MKGNAESKRRRYQFHFSELCFKENQLISKHKNHFPSPQPTCTPKSPSSSQKFNKYRKQSQNKQKVSTQSPETLQNTSPRTKATSSLKPPLDQQVTLQPLTQTASVVN
jgi:hypothetical protein